MLSVAALNMFLLVKFLMCRKFHISSVYKCFCYEILKHVYIFFFLFSPQKEGVLVKPLWSREGRAKNVDPFVYVQHKQQATVVTSDSEVQNLASLLFSRQERGTAVEEQSQRDPLDELLNKDFQKLNVEKPEKS